MAGHHLNSDLRCISVTTPDTAETAERQLTEHIFGFAILVRGGHTVSDSVEPIWNLPR